MRRGQCDGAAVGKAGGIMSRRAGHVWRLEEVGEGHYKINDEQTTDDVRGGRKCPWGSEGGERDQMQMLTLEVRHL